MSRKNFKVATTEDGKTTLTKIDKTPTAKVKTLKDKEALKKEREEQYKNFRIAALKRRAKRIGLSEEQINVKVKELTEQLNAPNNYDITIMFNPADFDMVKQALMNEDITWKLLVSTYGFLEGDAEVLATLRTIVPKTVKIYPHVKRKPNVLPTAVPYVHGAKKRTKAEKKALAKAAKAARKALNRNKGHNVKSEAKERLEQFLKNWHAEKRNLHGKKAKRKAFLGTQGSYEALPKRVKVKPKRQNFTKTRISKERRIVIPKATVKAQVSLKKASTDVKKAA
jgi:hypothetical protein